MNLIFDLDGTITDPKEGIFRSFRLACEKLKLDCPPEDTLASFIGPPIQESFLKLCGGDQALADQGLLVYREHFSKKGLFENELYEGIDGVLRLLCREHSIYLGTSKPRVYAEEILKHFEVDQWFKRAFGSELDGRLGKKSDLLAHLLKEEGLSPKDCVMIGDRSFDGLGARANGIAFVGVLWGYGSQEELEAAGASEILDDPEDLAMLNWEALV